MEKEKQTELKINVPAPNSTEALAWNESVKLAAMLLHWNMTDNYQDLIRLMGVHQVWSMQCVLKQNDVWLEQLLQQWPIADKNPRIWACFHIGPYALISRALIQKGMGVAILLKDEVYDEQHTTYVAHFTESFGHPPTPKDLQFIRSGSKSSMAQLKRCLAAGLHVVCFVDGQEGASSKGKTTIQMHGMEIDVRLGVAALSHWSKVPVRPLVLTVQEERLRVVSPADYTVSTKEEYKYLLQDCYNLISDLTADELIQWDLIPALFDTYFLERMEEENSDDFFEKALWIPILVPDRYLLIDLRTGNGLAVSKTKHRMIYGHIQNVMANF